MIKQFSNLSSVLAIDSLTCMTAGLLMLLGADWLSPMLGLPAPLLGWAGVALFPVAALFGWMSRQQVTSRALLLVAVLGNALWVVGSLIVAIAFSPTPLGFGFVLGQAAVVALLALMEARGLTPATSAMA